MGEGGKTQRPERRGQSPTADVAPDALPAVHRRVDRSSAIGPARFDAQKAERQAAADQIGRSLKAWRAASGAAPQGEAAIPRGGGAPLASAVRSTMEPKVGANLDNVRVHTGSESSEAARGFGARAFTVGTDIHFNAGEYKPGTKEGDKLLAHELTHVVQGQTAGVQRKPHEGEGGDHEKGGVEVSDPSEPAEQEADAAGEKIGEELHGAQGGEGDAAEKKPAGEKKPAADKKPAAEKAPAVGAARIMRAEDPKKAKALADIKQKAVGFGGGMLCVECAAALKQVLVAAGVKGTTITLTNKPKNKSGFVYCISKNKNISTSNFHVGIVVDGIVYCNQHPSGLARGAWVADFAHMNNPAGGAGAFDVGEESF